MKPLALRITGEMENHSPMHISTEKAYQIRGSQVKQSDMYPLGQNLRGALGYIFLDMKSKITGTYENGHPVIYFRDALVKHHDGVYLPVVKIDKGIKEVTYECSGCRRNEKYPATKEAMIGISLGSRGTVKNMYLTDVVSGRHKYRFEAVFNMKAKTAEGERMIEEYLAEVLAALKYAEEHGIYIGKRSSKGLGKLSVKKINIQPVTREDIKKRAETIRQIAGRDGKITVHLLSDTLGKPPLSGEDIARDARNAAKFFDPEYIQYTDPKIIPIGKPIELSAQKSFLDMKAGKPGFNQASVISRGVKISYQITDVPAEFFYALALAEQLRGLGDRTSFGKGEFSVS